MGVTPDHVVRNDEQSGAESEVDHLSREDVFSDWKKKYDFFADHFLNISAWDRKLGITHIVRGNDRLPYDPPYRECYRKLKYLVPNLLYVPVLLNGEGERISFNCPEYFISNVMQQYGRSVVEKLLLRSCLRNCDDWSDLENPEMFFAKLIQEPRVVLP
jgi:hypothetical protein